MNTPLSRSQVYHKAAGRGDEESPFDGPTKEEAQKDNDDAARLSAKSQWVQSTITQELRKELKTEADSLIEQALELARGYHMKGNHLQIIDILIRAHEKRELIKKFQINNK